MSAEQSASPEDIARAGLGDLEALRRLRGHWQGLASGRIVHPLVPKSDAMSQMELLAEMAASAGREPLDWVALFVAYHLRAAGLRGELEACAYFAKEAVAADNLDELDRWTRSEVEFGERLGHYSAKMGDLFARIMNDADAAAALLTVPSLQADEGNEKAGIVIQRIIETVTPDLAAAIQTAARKLEDAD